ncbi:MAG: hypothetical protein WCZ23_13180 [Rhodospirillaceae bacterium]
MKKTISLLALGALVGGGLGIGVAVAAGEPSIQGIYGYFAGSPVYKVVLQANSGVFVDVCPSGQTLTSMPMANGGHALLCK